MTAESETIRPTPSGNWTALCVSGADRRSFLQGQLTQDVNRLAPGVLLLAGWASPKGRLLCIAWLFEWQDVDWLVLPAELADPIAKRLRMFVLRSAVSIEPAAATVRPIPVAELQQHFETISYDSDASLCLLSDKCSALLTANLREMALLVTRDGAPEQHSPELGNAWRLAMINAGLPTVWPATREEFVPQMVNMDLLDAISFTKGCYVGQEIVARTQNLGRIKRRMYAFSAAAPDCIEAGSPVYSGSQTVGQVVDAVTATTDEVRLLAVIRLDNIKDQLALDPEGRHRLQRMALPYPMPEDTAG